MKPEHNSEKNDFGMLETLQSIDIEKDWKQVRQRMGFEKGRESHIGRESQEGRESHIGRESQEGPESHIGLASHKGPESQKGHASQKGRASHKRDLARVWRVAASIIIILGVGYLSQLYVFSAREMISAKAVDELMTVTLQDGSRVTLNSNSELSYPEKFRGGKREVLLRGEAFFEVERNPDKPFRVSIEHKAMVEVLGTSFNIRSEQSGEAINVLVVEGRISFKGVTNEKPGMILEKNEQATMTHGTLRRDKVVNKNMLSWKTGILCFDQSFIVDVVAELEVHYMRDIILDEDIPRDLKFTSTIDNQDIESVLEELSLVLGLTVSYEDNKVHISKPHE